MNFFLIFLLGISLFSGCQNKEKQSDKGAPGKNSSEAEGVSIAVFIPGVMAGSAIYEMLADGTLKAAKEFAVSNPPPQVKIIEAEFNQATWETQMTTLAASHAYDLIVSSNPAMPVIVSEVSKKFPAQKFLLLDAELSGNPNVYTFRYNQREQAYMAGYFAALVSEEISALAAAQAGAGQTARGEKILGLVAGQEYPAMNNIILPGFTEGAMAVDPGFKVEFRVVGNWFDAAKAAELAASLIRAGANVLLPIAGGAGHGVVQAAADAGAKVIWFDTSGYNIKPGTVVGSVIVRQDKAAYEKVMLYLNGQLPFGKAEIAGAADGFVDFVDDDPLYVASVSRTIREKQAQVITRLRSGELRLD